MNQRIILFTLIAFFCNLVTFATEITESEAFNIANNFFKTNSKNNVLKHTNRTITLAHKAITSKGTPVYYVYNQGACDGFVIISGDDKTRQSVLGYSDTGSFDYDNMPENMRWWLNQYENQILYLQNKKTALDRELYSLSEWEQIMRNELDEARPILYRGTGDGNIGHAFVCDWYNTNGYFHINWGWSGNANGYFLTTALTPYAQETTSSYDGYNYYQAMVIGIQKAEENSIKAPVIMSGTTMYAEADEYNLGEFAKIHISSLSGNHMETIQLYMAMLVVDNEGNTVCGYTQASDSPTELKMNYGWNNWGVSFLLPSTLKDGTYTVKPCYRINEETSFRQVKFPIYHPQYLVMKVEENKVYFSFPENFTPNLNVNEIHATASITNTGGYFTGYIPMIIINTEGYYYYYYANTVYQYVTLEQNETKTIEFQGNMSVDIEFGATYYLALLDPITGNALGNIVKFILKDEISNLDNIEIDTNTPIEYYNLQGVKVENPENGIFIRKQGSKTTKVIM